MAISLKMAICLINKPPRKLCITSITGFLQKVRFIKFFLEFMLLPGKSITLKVTAAFGTAASQPIIKASDSSVNVSRSLLASANDYLGKLFGKDFLFSLLTDGLSNKFNDLDVFWFIKSKVIRTGLNASLKGILLYFIIKDSHKQAEAEENVVTLEQEKLMDLLRLCYRLYLSTLIINVTNQLKDEKMQDEKMDIEKLQDSGDATSLLNRVLNGRENELDEFNRLLSAAWCSYLCCDAEGGDAMGKDAEEGDAMGKDAEEGDAMVKDAEKEEYDQEE
ncbi:hypothetical protein L1987_10426 [Smallanthus sonchifolius]|uniref:Uncharacterized protein n=1 Tax=Smallanthus sonchifolius TaxID=185202 RepID=A0ACB9JS91_9ASTR|nr:hypothetical protein L1987_10426 [Smallanthus sonchifolius]